VKHRWVLTGSLLWNVPRRGDHRCAGRQDPWGRGVPPGGPRVGHLRGAEGARMELNPARTSQRSAPGSGADCSRS